MSLHLHFLHDIKYKLLSWHKAIRVNHPILTANVTYNVKNNITMRDCEKIYSYMKVRKRMAICQGSTGGLDNSREKIGYILNTLQDTDD